MSSITCSRLDIKDIKSYCCLIHNTCFCLAWHFILSSNVMFTFMCTVQFMILCDCFWLQRNVYDVWQVCYPSLKPETMPLNQGVKKHLAIVKQLSLESFVSILISDLLSVRVEKKMFMKENSVFNLSCLRLILSIIKHPEKKCMLYCHLLEYECEFASSSLQIWNKTRGLIQQSLLNWGVWVEEKQIIKSRYSI